MWKFITQLFLIIFLTHDSFSQSTDIKKLKSLLGTSTDTAKVNVLNDLAKAYQFSDVQSLLDYSIAARDLSRKLSFRKGEARAICNIGTYYSRIGNNDEAIKHFRLAYSLVDPKNYYVKMILLYNLGVNDPTDKRLTYLFDAIRLAKKIHFKQIGYFYSSVGKYYYNKSDFSNSYKYFIEALKISQKLNDSTTIAVALADISSILDTQDDEKSFAHCKDAIRLAQHIHNKMLECIIKEELASYYRKKGDLDTALCIAVDALKLAKEVKYQPGVWAALAEVGHIHQLKGNLKEAIRNYTNALLMVPKSPEDKGDILIKLASIQNTLHRPKKAYQYLKNAKSYLEQTKNLLVRSDLYFELSEM